MVDFVALFDGDEEDFAFAFAPGVQEILRGEEDRRGVGEGAAEEHGGGAAVDEQDLAAEVEGDRGAVGLVAVEEDGVRGEMDLAGFELLDAFRRSFSRRASGRSGRRRCGRR